MLNLTFSTFQYLNTFLIISGDIILTDIIRSQLIGIEGVYKGKDFDLRQDVVVIGRDVECDIVLNDKKSSRKHARLQWDGTHYWIQDLKSTNGVFINGFPVSRSRLQNGDRLVLGGTVFLFGDKTDPHIHEKPSQAVLIDTNLPFQERNTIFLKPKKSEEISPEDKKDLEREQLERNYERYAIMLKISNTLASSFKLSEILEKIMKEIFTIFPVDRGIIMLFSEEKKEYIPQVVWTRDKSDTKKEIVISKTLIDKVINEKQAVSTSDIRNESCFTKSESIFFSAIRSVMCVPIIFKDKVLGLIQVDTKTSRHCFSKHDLELLTGVSYQTAIAIENAGLYEKIETETKIRTNLSRYLPVNLVEDVISERIGLGLGGELSNVTILFSDIRGFTRMSENMKPQDVVRLLNEYLTAMNEVIFENKGMVDKFIGDAIMTIFGGPWVEGDGILDAVNTAIIMLEVLDDLNRKWSCEGRPEISIGIGINFGKAVLGNIGSDARMEYTAIGDTVNTASRFVSIAGKNEIIVSESIYENLKDKFVFEPQPPAEVKGKEKPINIYKVISYSHEFIRGVTEADNECLNNSIPIPPDQET